MKSERWNKEEIRKAAKIISESEKNKHLLVKVLDEIVHWLLVLVAFTANLAIAAFLTVIYPLISSMFYIFLSIAGLGVGLLIEIPLRDLKKIHKDKFFFARVMLPVIALANVFIIIGMRETLAVLFDTEIGFNAITAGIVYGVFFLLPHAFFSVKKKYL